MAAAALRILAIYMEYTERKKRERANDENQEVFLKETRINQGDFFSSLVGTFVGELMQDAALLGGGGGLIARFSGRGSRLGEGGGCTKPRASKYKSKERKSLVKGGTLQRAGLVFQLVFFIMLWLLLFSGAFRALGIYIWSLYTYIQELTRNPSSRCPRTLSFCRTLLWCLRRT